MKNTMKMAGLTLALALTSAFAQAEENIAYIDSAAIFQSHPDREAVAKKIDDELKGPAEKLQAAEKKIVDKMKALEKEAPKLRRADIQKREDEINKLRQSYQEQVNAFQQKNEKLQYEERAKLLQSIQEATNEVAKEKNYTYVIDANALVYAADGKDITKEVLDHIKPAEKAPAKAEEKKAGK
ncbi:OmpH family outer membrane protein [Pasteurellaceae bacterium 20609_3]|uniref:OmpH family outer membrane protein n=1 Tax=Spirabiliibacterium mucosae TaxID=28156 RepID=UPI001AAE05AF|nr:OmpH family outer membrane protein [Spirabiliibacterium mucosae]MBE2898042.1 OmpH family outer membrane protein [Spirabiliibacterium mucosae]